MTRRTLIAILLLAPAAVAESPLDPVFARFNHTDTPGCAVAVSRNDEMIIADAYGMADLEHDVPIRPNTIFEAGSVSKQFTATAILLLAQEGKLSLDDAARKYIPELPDYGTPLTIRHLLNHTSGLRDWGEVEAIAGWPRTTRAYTHAHVLEIIARQRALNYTPGAEYSYTNSGYNLAAMIVERVSGKPFAEFTRERIFLPLGMNSTSWRDDFRRIVKNRAIAYQQTAGGIRQLMPFEDVHGNGGLLTTVGDLLRWNGNFTTAKVGGRALLEEQVVRPKLKDGSTSMYAAGLMILHYKGLDEVSHSGTTAGYNAWLGRYPKQGISVAVLCNSSAANGTQLGHAVADLYMQDAIQPVQAAPRPTAEHVEPWTPTDAELAGLAGDYASDEAEVTFHLAIEQGRAVLHRRPDAMIALTPTSRDTFNAPGLGTIRFLRDGNSRVTEMSIKQPRVWDLRLARAR